MVKHLCSKCKAPDFKPQYWGEKKKGQAQQYQTHVQGVDWITRMNQCRTAADVELEVLITVWTHIHCNIVCIGENSKAETVSLHAWFHLLLPALGWIPANLHLRMRKERLGAVKAPGDPWRTRSARPNPMLFPTLLLMWAWAALLAFISRMRCEPYAPTWVHIKSFQVTSLFQKPEGSWNELGEQDAHNTTMPRLAAIHQLPVLTLITSGHRLKDLDSQL
jgi:hypothetical protein